MLRIRPKTYIQVWYPVDNDQYDGMLQCENTLDEELSFDEYFLYGLIDECWRDYGTKGHTYEFEVPVIIEFHER